MSNNNSKQPIITRKSDVVIVQLPFDFETLFTQPLSGLTAGHGQNSTQPSASAGPTAAAGREPHDINKILADLPPRNRRSKKSKKATLQHLEELGSRHLRLSENGVDIYCIPCDSDLTDGGRVKKSTMRLHLQCKKHLFNVKQHENRCIPPEIHRDDILNLYNCVLCGKAVTNDLHDVKRHCNGKRHQELLALRNEEKLLKAARKSEEREEVIKPYIGPVDSEKRSARDVNREYVDDVLDYLMKTNSTITGPAVKLLRNLLGKWTTMRLPDAESIRRNHLPRYFEKHPEVKAKYESVVAKRAARKAMRNMTSGDSIEVGQHEEHDSQDIEHVINQEDVDMQSGTVTVTELELAHAIQALAGQNQIFTVSDFRIHPVPMSEEGS